jgi:drug/metabolite transporter (DMT)-like permease
LQKIGVGVGLAGVALVVGERAHAGTATLASVLTVVWALLCVTGGTLYQRQFCAGSDLRAAVCIHFAATALLMLPLGLAFEGFAIAWNEPIALALGYHVVLGSIGAFSILHLLMRHGQATGVTSLLYLTPPVAAIVEWAVYGVAPTLAMWAGMAIACIGVALATVNAGRLARGAVVEERA